MQEAGTLGQRILALLSQAPGLSDREITDRLLGNGKAQQPINGECRRLEAQGLIRRDKWSTEPIRDYLCERAHTFDRVAPTPKPPTTGCSNLLDEDTVKKHVEEWLRQQGWTRINVAWGHDHGADIDASLGHERWVIEVKGAGSRQAMRVNYFLAILGELLQRMDRSETRYSIALPDVEQFRRLWGRLPALAKERTTITALCVDSSGRVEQVH